MNFELYYQDEERIWSPVSRLYYSQTSKLILSNYPTEIVEENTSYFCPQCLNRYQEEELIKSHNLQQTIAGSSFSLLSLTQQVQQQNWKGYCPNCYQCQRCTGV